MPVINMVPAGFVSRPTGSGGQAWGMFGAIPIQNADANYVQGYGANGGADSESCDATAWVDVATGLTVDWSDKSMTEIALYTRGQIIIGASAYLEVTMTNTAFQTPFAIWSANIPWIGGGLSTVEIARQTIAPGGWSEKVRDWLIAQNLLMSTILSPRAGDVTVNMDQNIVAVTYNNIVPPVVPPLGFAMEL